MTRQPVNSLTYDAAPKRQPNAPHAGDTPRLTPDQLAGRAYFARKQAELGPGYRPGSEACWNMTAIGVPCLGLLGHAGPCGEINR